MPIQGPLRKFLTRLHHVGAFEEHIEPGKKLAGHQVNPSAPLSTFFFTLRTPMSAGEKKGPLTDDDIRSIAADIYHAVKKAGIAFDAVAGIPHAGNPIAYAFAEVYRKVHSRRLRVIRLRKAVGGQGQTLMTVYVRDRPKDRMAARLRVLLLDDLITGATTKWIATDALRRVGYELAGIGVFMDREQGGSTELRESGILFASVVTAARVIEFYRNQRLIPKRNAGIHLEYLAKTKK